MLAVILKILSILGIILLILLGILVAVLLLVLFMPIVYRINAQKEAELLQARVKIRWLFGLVRAGYVYPEPGKFVVKVLWITVYDSGKKADAVDSTPNTSPTVSDNEETAKETKESPKPSNPAEQTETDGEESTNEELPNDDEHGEAEATDKKKSIFEKIRYTIKQIYDKMKHVIDNIKFYKKLLQDEETKLLVSHACNRLGKILKNIRPRKLKADILFGADSPDTTGYAFAVYSMFSPKLGKDVYVTPDFTQKILEGRIYAAGHITIFTLLVNVLAVLFDKRLKLLKHRLDHHKKKAQTEKE